MKLKKVDYINLVVLSIMIASVTVLCVWYYNYQYRECLANPLVYGANEIYEEYGYDVYGTINMMTPDNLIAPRITFDTKRIRVGGDVLYYYDDVLNITINKSLLS